jgi:hypothetical protein
MSRDALPQGGFLLHWACTGRPSLTISAKPVSVATVDREGRTIWVVAAERNAQRFIVHADEKLTAFIELESVIRGRQ